MKRKKLFCLAVAAVLACPNIGQWNVLAQGQYAEMKTGFYYEPEDLPQKADDAESNNYFEYRELEDGTLKISKYTGNETEVVIPEKVDGKLVSEIGDVFSDCSFTKITIPKSVVTIECKFRGCNRLMDITVDKDNPNYCSQGGALYSKDLKSLFCYPRGMEGVVEIPDSVTRIEHSAFYGCGKLTEIKIPNSVSDIENFAFAQCVGLEHIKLPKGLKEIRGYLFSNCINLKEIDIPNSVTIIWNWAFSHCDSLTDLDMIPESVTEIHMLAFASCQGLKSITWPKNVKEIGYGIFSGCSNLSRVEIPKEVTDIYFNAFSECSNELLFVVSSGSKAEAFVKEYGKNYTYFCLHHWKKTIRKATTEKNGKIIKTCTECGEKDTAAIYAAKTVNLLQDVCVYNGKSQKPSAVLKDSKGNKLNYKTDYAVSCSKNIKDVGNYTVTVKLKGNYSGSIKKTFTIIPKGTSFSKVSPVKKGFTAKWKKQAVQTTGYELAYSADSKFKKGVKTITVSKNKTITKSIKNLKGGKKYYVRLRTYKMAKANGKSIKICSKWSKAKTVTTKK